MNKRRYRTTDVKDVNWEEIGRQGAAQARVVFAVDVAKERFVGAVMKADRTVLSLIRWCHPEQTRELIDGLLGQIRPAVLEMVMEPSGTYGDAVREVFIREAVSVYRISPKRVHDAAEVFDGVPSLHDAKAAHLIGCLHLDGISQRWTVRSAQRRELAAKLSLVKLYRERIQSDTNRLEAQLARHWPELTRLLDLGTVSLARLLAHFGSAAAVVAEPEAARALLRRSGRAALAAEKIEAVIESARHTVGVACLEAERALLQTLAQDLWAQRQALGQVEKAVAQQVEADPMAHRLATVVGKTSAAVLIETLGDPQGYAEAGSYLKAAGLNLKERSSGKHTGELRITKRGPALARLYLYFAALRWIHRDPLARAWYQRKVAHDGGCKGKAIVALMRKLTKALWHLARGGYFDSTKLFNRKGLAAAA